jgi:hypothetical protein
MSDDIRDELPADLIPSEYVGVYQFPDNSRRRIPAYIYLGVAAACLALWLAKRNSDAVLVNRGFLWAAVLLGVIGIFSFTSGWKMTVKETEALLVASKAVEFPVGHASAQQVWRGLRARPTWRVLCYSIEEPPKQRGFVLIDAIDGRVVEKIVQENPEDDWSRLNP